MMRTIAVVAALAAVVANVAAFAPSQGEFTLFECLEASFDGGS